MLLSPKKTKYALSMRRLRQIRGRNSKCNNLIKGDFGVVAEEGFWFKDRQIESVRLSTVRMVKKCKNSIMLCRVFPHKPISKKPLEVRLGRGKADRDYWAATVRPGTILFEYGNVTDIIKEQIIKAVRTRLPIKISVLNKKEEEMKKNEGDNV